MAPQRDRWAMRAADPHATEGEAVYARRRERRLSQPYSARLAGCARTGAVVQCGCGRRVLWHGCRSHLLCARCKRTRGQKQAARIRHALVEHGAHQEAGVHPVMLTLTARHASSVGDTRTRIAEGWAEFRKRWHKTFGYAFAFVGVWEITMGRDGLGHPHLHVIAFLPYVPGEMLSRWWRQSCRSSSHLNFKHLKSVQHAANYVSKYVSKGVETSEWSPKMRARVLAATYGTRWLCSSRSFWLPFEPCCPGCKRAVERVNFDWEHWFARHAPVLAIPPPAYDWEHPGLQRVAW